MKTCPRCLTRSPLRNYNGLWCICGWSWEPEFSWETDPASHGNREPQRRRAKYHNR